MRLFFFVLNAGQQVERRKNNTFSKQFRPGALKRDSAHFITVAEFMIVFLSAPFISNWLKSGRHLDCAVVEGRVILLALSTSLVRTSTLRYIGIFFKGSAQLNR